MATGAASTNKIHVKSYFSKYDTDNSGSISVTEFGSLVYDLGYKMDATDLQATVRSLDKDHSGLVSFDEFFTWWSSNDKFQNLDLHNNQTLRQAVEYFRKYDSDNTGKIGLAEYRQLCQDLGQTGLSDRDLAKGLIALDKNKDGQIDFNEFMNWLRWDN